jgi:hypothetical protein
LHSRVEFSICHTRSYSLCLSSLSYLADIALEGAISHIINLGRGRGELGGDGRGVAEFDFIAHDIRRLLLDHEVDDLGAERQHGSLALKKDKKK